MMLLAEVLIASIVGHRTKKAQRCALTGSEESLLSRFASCPLPVIDRLKAIILIVGCCGSTDDRNEIKSGMSLKDNITPVRH